MTPSPQNRTITSATVTTFAAMLAVRDQRHPDAEPAEEGEVERHRVFDVDQVMTTMLLRTSVTSAVPVVRTPPERREATIA